MTTTTKRSTKKPVALAALITVLAIGAAAFALGTRAQEDPMNLRAMPESHEVMSTAADARVFFGHQSVGGNVLSGVDAAFAKAGVAAPPVVESVTSPELDGGYIAHALIGQNGDPESKMRNFAEVLAGPMGDTVNVALMKLCWVDITAQTDVDAVFQQYKRTMTQLAEERPEIALLYSTVPLTTDRDLKGKVKALLGREDSVPADNAARERFNQLVRAEYASTGRLWDVAAVQSTSPDGERVEGTYDGATYYTLYKGYASDPGHLNEVGSAEAAAALLPLIGTFAKA